MAYFRDAEAKAILGVLGASCHLAIASFLYFKGSYADFPTRAAAHPRSILGVHRSRQRPAHPGTNFALADISRPCG